MLNIGTGVFVCLFNRCTDNPYLVTNNILYNTKVFSKGDNEDIRLKLGPPAVFDAMGACQPGTNLCTTS